MASRPHDDRRDGLRIDADAPATLRCPGRDAIDARMVDVSAGGAMLSLDTVLQRGDEIVFASRGVEVPSTVAWVSPGQCGLAFHRRLQLGEVALLARKGRRSLVANGGAE